VALHVTYIVPLNVETIHDSMQKQQPANYREMSQSQCRT